MTLTDAVVVPTTSVAQYLFFVLNTLGRDKIIRCLQYFGRFYTWYLLRTNGTKAQIAPWEAVKKQLGLVRKIMRAGKSADHFRSLMGLIQNKTQEPVLRYMNMMHALCFTIYLSFDSATLLDATGIRKMEKAKLYQREANRFWAMGLIASMLAQSYRLFLLNERLSTIDKKEADGVVEFRKAIQERSQARTQIVCDLCDVTAPTAALGWTKFDEGLIGLTGIFSSIVSVSSKLTKFSE
ncbi:Peroxisomal biogenesis factor 11 (PEX11) [Ceratocystis lukuohia]|uniref:Peroxisomal biogenesis factor 11 n=2 Tax=Ceratocystis TaxID=5157 RepID=A0A2C5WZB2_9PEZI|nr:hypothetical protein CFIMG_004887RAa [Ceratocystis fimbriata CBS 114723]